MYVNKKKFWLSKGPHFGFFSYNSMGIAVYNSSKNFCARLRCANFGPIIVFRRKFYAHNLNHDHLKNMGTRIKMSFDEITFFVLLFRIFDTCHEDMAKLPWKWYDFEEVSWDPLVLKNSRINCHDAMKRFLPSNQIPMFAGLFSN